MFMVVCSLSTGLGGAVSNNGMKFALDFFMARAVIFYFPFSTIMKPLPRSLLA